jgi:NADH dehydrogenase FAD-containing subunit
MLKRVRFIEGTAQMVDPVGRTVNFVDQNGRSRLLSYKHCVLAPGSVAEFFGIQGLAENALTLKTLGDAIRIRNRIIDQLERAVLLSGGTPGSLVLCICRRRIKRYRGRGELRLRSGRWRISVD